MSGSRARIIDGRAFDSEHEAERILAEARGRAEELYREAREQGRAEGRADAGALLASAQAKAARRLESAERELCRIVIAATERIVRAELATRPEAVLGVIREVIDQARLRRELTLRVNPADLRAIEHERAALVARLTEHGYLEIRADPGIKCGGCILESEIGRIDARLETQLEALERAMLDTLEPGAHWATRDDQA